MCSFFFPYLNMWDHLFNIRELIFNPALMQKTELLLDDFSFIRLKNVCVLVRVFFILAFTCHMQYTVLPIFSFMELFNLLLGHLAVALYPSLHTISSWVICVTIQSKVLVLVVFMLFLGRLILLIIYVWGHILFLHQMHLVLEFCKALSCRRAFILEGLLCWA